MNSQKQIDVRWEKISGDVLVDLSHMGYSPPPPISTFNGFKTNLYRQIQIYGNGKELIQDIEVVYVSDN